MLKLSIIINHLPIILYSVKLIYKFLIKNIKLRGENKMSNKNKVKTEISLIEKKFKIDFENIEFLDALSMKAGIEFDKCEDKWRNFELFQIYNCANTLFNNMIAANHIDNC
ncbi:MAG: hypothetical protein EPN82_13285 [Bacteroidetes bacterium]|nr:MAG: hypothetical protein EPN82_13285 [Bacteroidota bacterium]